MAWVEIIIKNNHAKHHGASSQEVMNRIAYSIHKIGQTPTGNSTFLVVPGNIIDHLIVDGGGGGCSGGDVVDRQNASHSGLALPSSKNVDG